MSPARAPGEGARVRGVRGAIGVGAGVARSCGCVVGPEIEPRLAPLAVVVGPRFVVPQGGGP